MTRLTRRAALAGAALLPLAAAWLRNSRDPLRDELLSLLRLPRYAAEP